MSELVISSEGRDRVRLTVAAGSVAVPFRDPRTAELAETLRWLLEDCREPAIGPEHRRLTEAASAVEDLGAALFQALSATPESAALVDAVMAASGEHTVRVVSDDPGFLALPWELLHRPRDADGSPVSAGELVRRRATPRGGWPADARPPATGPLRVLLVSPRPFGAEDVRPRTVRGPLLLAAESAHGDVEVDLLRPPTLDRLRTVLANSDRYDILHFDGHGYADVTTDGINCGLVFEDERGRAQAVPAEEFAELVPTDRVPLVVLNACRSAYHAVAAADHPPAEETNSVASALLDRGVLAVLAMTHDVQSWVVATFMATFYNAVVDGRGLAAAVAEGRRALLAEATDARSARPFHVIPVLYEQRPVDLGRRSGTRRARADRPDEPEPAWMQSLMYQDDELADIDRHLHRGEPVVVHAPVASGKSVLLRAYVQYAQLSRGFDHIEFITGGELTVDSLLPARRVRDSARRFPGQRVLHVWDGVDGHVGVCTEAARTLPPGHHVLMSARYDAFTMPHHSHATGDLPDELVGNLVAGLITEAMRDAGVFPLDEARFRWLIRCMGWHGGSVAAVFRAKDGVPLSEIPRRLDLGYPEGEGDPFLDPAVQRCLADLPPPLLTTLSYLGLYGHEIDPHILSVLTDRGLTGDVFGKVTGTHISLAQWRKRLDQAHRAGVLAPNALGAGLGYRISPLVAYALRGELARRFSPDQLRLLHHSAASSLIGMLGHAFAGVGPALGYAGTLAREFFAVAMDSNVWLAMLRAVEAGDYRHAAALAAAYQDDKPVGSPGWSTAIGVVEHVAQLSAERLRSDLDAVPLALTVHEILGEAAMAHCDWDRATMHVERLLVHRDHPLMRLRLTWLLLWRVDIAVETGHLDTLRSRLADAVRQARDSDQALDQCRTMLRRAVRVLELPPLSAVDLAREVGLTDLVDELRAAANGDAGGRLDETLLADLREALLHSQLSEAADLQRTLGRAALDRREIDVARHWFTAVLRLELSTTGVGDPARTAMQLAILEEEIDNLDDAASWCRFVLDSRSANDLEKAHAHYELGIVELKRDREHDALQELAAARTFYAAQGMTLYIADVDALVAQALHRQGDLAAAVELGESVVRTMLELQAPERTVGALKILVQALSDMLSDMTEARERCTRILSTSEHLTPDLVAALVEHLREMS